MITTTNVDLRQLAVDRSRRGQGGALPKRRYPWISRRMLPAGIAIGFASLIGWAAREQFHRPIEVTAMPVIAQRGEVFSASGSPLFQAAGWVEPRPRPVFATALTMGVVEEVCVVEGQDVVAGDLIAKLIDADARLTVEQGKAAQGLREAELASILAEREAAQVRLDRPLHLDAALAEAESMLAEIDAELQAQPFQLASAEARRTFAHDNLEGKRSADSAVAVRLRQQAESALDEADADWHELQGRADRLRKQRDALDRRRQALADQRELLVDERRALADAIAKEKAAEAQLAHAKLDLQVAELALTRTSIHSPIAGRVLEVLAQPGTRLSGVASETPMSSAAVASVYDPKMLQVRADVRLDDVRSVVPGQVVKIETPAAPAPLTGTVLSVTSQANVGKNTLEVKVAIDDPAAMIRPEMLVTATFLSPKLDRDQAAAGSSPMQIVIPRRIVVESAGETSVWVAAAGSVAHRRPVSLGTEVGGGLVQVTDGLSSGDWLIASEVASLTEGCRIHIVGEVAETAVPASADLSSSPVHH